jgi:hypothetical protein
MHSSEKLETDIQLVKFSEELTESWDSFVEQKAKNATFLHTRKFFNHNPLNSGDDSSFVFMKKNSILAVFPANIYERDGKKILHSYLRSTYGGIIYSNDCSTADLNNAILLLIEQAKMEGIAEIIIRPTFSIYHKTLSAELDYVLWRNGFGIKTRELELAIDLQFPVEALYADSTRRSIKKSVKEGIVVKETGDLEGYWEVLDKNLTEKYGKPPVHAIGDIRRLASLVGAEKLRLFCAYKDDAITGGILTFVANNQTIHAQYIASDSAFQELRPLNAVIDFIARKAKEEGFKYFNLGMVSEPGGLEMNEGLCRFKEGFGARGVLRETMHLLIS